MTSDHKIIKTKLELLKPEQQLGSVSQACEIMGFSRDSSCRLKELHSGQRLAREGRSRPGQMADGLVLPTKPGNAGGGKEP